MNKVKRKIIVSVIGDAKLDCNDVRLQLAYETGCALVDNEFAIMTGGMGGIMDAALSGGRSSKNWTHGCCIGLIPGSNVNAPNISKNADIVIPTGMDHGRNFIIAQSDAVIAIGGGAGTLSEMALAWIHKRLLIALRCPGWSGKLADKRIDSRQRYQEIPDDRVYGAATGIEAVKIILQLLHLYNNKHSRISE